MGRASLRPQPTTASCASTCARRTALARAFDVVFRVYDDGLGFRYEFAEQPNLTTLRIGSELTEFNIAEDGEAWWIPSHEWNREEYLYHRTSIEQASNTQTPMTMRLDSGLHVSIHEAALIDYAGMNLRRAEGRRFVRRPDARLHQCGGGARGTVQHALADACRSPTRPAAWSNPP